MSVPVTFAAGYNAGTAGDIKHPVAAGDVGGGDQFLGAPAHLGADPAEFVDLRATPFQLKAGLACHVVLLTLLDGEV
jgi:hypothetical protein